MKPACEHECAESRRRRRRRRRRETVPQARNFHSKVKAMVAPLARLSQLSLSVAACWSLIIQQRTLICDKKPLVFANSHSTNSLYQCVLTTRNLWLSCFLLSLLLYSSLLGWKQARQFCQACLQIFTLFGSVQWWQSINTIPTHHLCGWKKFTY